MNAARGERMGFSILVHCGTYKTGTSSIQNTLYGNKDILLSRYGVLYPEAGLRKDKAIGMRHKKFPFAKVGEELDNLLDNLREEVVEAITTSSLNQVVISSEAWSHPGMAGNIRHVVDLLKSLGANDVHGVLYIRNIYDYVRRHYREFTLRYKNKLKIDDYILAKKIFFNYNLLIRKLEENLGGNLTVKNYDKIDSVLSDFLSVMGGGVCEHDMLGGEQKHNKGQDPVSCELVRMFKPFVSSSSKIPTSQDLEEYYGLSFSKSICEPLKVDYFKLFSDEYLRDFIELTGWPSDEAKNLFYDPQANGENIYNLSAPLDTMGVGYLRR